MLAALTSAVTAALADAAHIARAVARAYAALPTTAAALAALPRKEQLLLMPKACGLLLAAAWLIHLLRARAPSSPRPSFHLTRLLLYRCMGGVYCVAFLVACMQHSALHGPHGLQPSLQPQQQQPPLTLLAARLSLALAPALPPPLTLPPDVAYEGSPPPPSPPCLPPQRRCNVQQVCCACVSPCPPVWRLVWP
jgi:hypothetical protein